MEIELQHLRSFIVLAEERHFGRAAALLHVTQPTLSRQIRRLEDAVGALLLDRAGRPLRLTATGTAFLSDARLILDQTQRAVERGRRTAGGALGHLSIAALPWTYDAILPPIVRGFHAGTPDAILETSVRAPYDQVEALEKKWLDVGFVRPVVVPQALQIEQLLEEALVAVLPERHRLAGRPHVSLEELAGLPFVSIARSAAPGFDYMQARLFAQRGFTPDVVCEAPDPQAQLALVAAGLGVGLHIAPAVNCCERGVAFTALDGEVPTTPLALVWRRNDERALVQRFVETAREVVRSMKD